MTSLNILDFEALLKPIAEDKPAGEDLRADISPTSPYFAIKDARSNARAEERNNLFSDSEEGAASALKSWKAILKQAPKLLAEQTKDLEVAVWLIEALVRVHGFAGLREGLQLLEGLVDNFWDNLYPLPDEEDGNETRAIPVTGLSGEGSNGTLIVPINCAPITVEKAGKGPYSVWDYSQAQEVARIKDKKQQKQRIEAGALELKQFDGLLKATPDENLSGTQEDIQACLDSVENLDKSFTERCGAELAPSFTNIRKTLTECLKTVTGFVDKRKNAAAESEAATAAIEQNSEQAGSEADGTEEGVISSTALMPLSGGSATMERTTALAQLKVLADFFRKTEPHSPISYSIDRLIRWAAMPLPELMTEMIRDEVARHDYSRLAGVELSGQTPVQAENESYGQAEQPDLGYNEDEYGEPNYGDEQNEEPSMGNSEFGEGGMGGGMNPPGQMSDFSGGGMPQQPGGGFPGGPNPNQPDFPGMGGPGMGGRPGQQGGAPDFGTGPGGMFDDDF